MREGTVVVVTGKIDDRVRNRVPNGLNFGTLWFAHDGIAWVLLTDGDIWRGPNYEIAPFKEQNSETV